MENRQEQHLGPRDELSIHDMDAEELFPEDLLPEDPVIDIIEPTSKAILNSFFGHRSAWEMVNDEQRRGMMPDFGILIEPQLADYLLDNEL